MTAPRGPQHADLVAEAIVVVDVQAEVIEVRSITFRDLLPHLSDYDLAGLIVAVCPDAPPCVLEALDAEVTKRMSRQLGWGTA